MPQPIEVLHVDDDFDFGDLTATFLERQSDRFEVQTVTSAAEGFELLSDRPPDCLISDYDMPEQNGIEFLREVREHWPDLPFILFTGKGSEEVASEAISAGVTDYLQKGSGSDRYELLANRIEQAVDRYRTTQELERQNDLFAKTQDIALIGAWEHDLRRDDLTWTNQVYKMHGVSEEFDPAIESVLELYHPDDRPKLREAVERARTAGEPYDLEVRLIARNDGDRWIRTVGDPQVEDETVVRVRGTVHDITERKEREGELQRQRDRYQSLFENNPQVIWEQDYSEAVKYLTSITSDIDDVESYLLKHPQEIERLMDRVKIIDVNQNAVEHYEAPSKAALLENLDQVFTEDTIDVLAAEWAAIAAGETEFRSETVGQTFSGTTREELMHILVPKKYADDYSRVYVIGTEITEQKERERRLKRQNERLDQFASVVSHDLRNPLQTAEGWLELVREECNSPHVQDIAAAHERMNQLIEDLLTLARAGRESIDRQTIALDRVLAECWETIQTADATLLIETEQAIQADRDRLQQLLINLLRNAVEHGGTNVSITVGALEGGFYVEDNGPGIPEAERREVFDPGYSATQEGTGFGLSIIEQVAEVHEWDIRLTEGSTGGARFEITGVDIPE